MATTTTENQRPLERALGLKEAASLNMIDMVGIGPFVVIPAVIQLMHGPQAIFAWILGAVLALIDGMIWAELGAAYPEAGGSYAFLKAIYGPNSWGKLFSFLFIWQTLFQAPLVVASGSIGFSQYFTYLADVGPIGQKAISGGLVILLTAILYRRISTIGKLSVFLWVGVIGTILWLIVGGVTHFNPALAFDYTSGGSNPDGLRLDLFFWGAVGQASVQTIYTYLGYYNVCHLGGEIKQPEKIIPKSILISIIGIAVLYLAMQLSVLGVIPWQKAAESKFIFSTFIEQLYGHQAATWGTVLILWIAFSSLFAVILGYSRVPYAAAKDGAFFRVFARVHPTKHFPTVSLLVLGGIAFCFSLLFKLTDVIKAILAMRILVQFIAQAAGVIGWHLKRKREGKPIPFRMILFPIPAILAIVIWAFLFYSTGAYAIGGVGMLILGAIVYLIRAKMQKEWPFALSGEALS